MPALLTLITVVCLAHAAIIEVPNDYPSVTPALEATETYDTVWVHPGVYSDRLIFPAHDVVLISDYFVTGDTNAIQNTIIDASDFASFDTASVLIFVRGSTRATVVGGFTLAGGHGMRDGADAVHGGGIFVVNSSPSIQFCRITANSCYHAFAIYSSNGSPDISHCNIYGNCGNLQTIYFLGNDPNVGPVDFEWNDMHENFACDSAIGNYVVENGVTMEMGNLIFRFNHFHDYVGGHFLGTVCSHCSGAIYGNVYERLSTPDWGTIVFSDDADIPVEDNVFIDCALFVGSAVRLSTNGQPHNFRRSLIQRNWFENLTNSLGPSCLFMPQPNAEVRDNVFFNCRGPVGAVQFSQQGAQGCDVVFERNHFFFNQAVGSAEWNGSAFSSAGNGPPCTFTDNWFEGNEGWAVNFDSTITPQADMSNNYWGDPSGPFHPTENPGGLGDSVPANVHVTPWLTEPPGLSKAIEERLSVSPEDWSLEQAYPNPFNATTTLRLTSAKPQPFEVSAYNLLGQKVADVWQGVVPKNAAVDVHWNGDGSRGSVASGIYYLMAVPRGPGARSVKSVKVVLLR